MSRNRSTSAGLYGEIVRPGEQVARGLGVAAVAQVAGAVHHQAGIGGHLADDRLVALLGIGRRDCMAMRA